MAVPTRRARSPVRALGRISTRCSGRSSSDGPSIGEQPAKLIGFDRLDEMGIETCSRSLPSSVVLTIAGQRDDGDRILALTPDLPGHFIAVHAGQAEVEEHDVGV